MNEFQHASVEKSLGYEVVLPGTSTAVGLANIPAQPCVALIQCAMLVDGAGKGNVAVRFLDLPQMPPTSEIGMELNPGQVYRSVANLPDLKFIGVAADARINVKYEPYPSAL
jgi:hypothetical protein